MGYFVATVMPVYVAARLVIFMATHLQSGRCEFCGQCARRCQCGCLCSPFQWRANVDTAKKQSFYAAVYAEDVR